jgi:hypothetical protein
VCSLRNPDSESLSRINGCTKKVYLLLGEDPLSNIECEESWTQRRHRACTNEQSTSLNLDDLTFASSASFVRTDAAPLDWKRVRPQPTELRARLKHLAASRTRPARAASKSSPSSPDARTNGRAPSGLKREATRQGTRTGRNCKARLVREQTRMLTCSRCTRSEHGVQQRS